MVGVVFIERPPWGTVMKEWGDGEQEEAGRPTRMQVIDEEAKARFWGQRWERSSEAAAGIVALPSYPGLSQSCL